MDAILTIPVPEERREQVRELLALVARPLEEARCRNDAAPLLEGAGLRSLAQAGGPTSDGMTLRHSSTKVDLTPARERYELHRLDLLH